MIKFEVGQIYKYGACEGVEITKRTEKTVWYTMYQHTGKWNEIVKAQGHARVKDWIKKEVVFIGRWQVNADELYFD